MSDFKDYKLVLSNVPCKICKKRKGKLVMKKQKYGVTYTRMCQGCYELRKSERKIVRLMKDE